jgi:hypothetical protein
MRALELKIPPVALVILTAAFMWLVSRVQLDILFNHGCTRIDTDADSDGRAPFDHQTVSILQRCLPHPHFGIRVHPCLSVVLYFVVPAFARFKQRQPTDAEAA